MHRHRCLLLVLVVATVFHLTCAHGAPRTGRPNLVFSSSTGRFFVHTSVRPTVSVYWDRVIQDIAAKRGPGPVKAAGAYAILHASIFKAWRIAKNRRRFTRRCKLLAMHHAARVAVLRSFPTDRKKIIRAFRMAPKRCRARYLRIAARRIGVRVAATTYRLYNTQIIPPPTSDKDDRPDIEEWRPERVPIDSKTGRLQKALSPEWGGKYTFSIPNGLAISVPPPKPFLLGGGPAGGGKPYRINPAFVKQAQRIVDTSAGLTPEQRLSAEAWEAGGGTGYPPGHWLTITQWVSARDRHTDDEDVGLFYAVANALSDAGVATWAVKYTYDYARPVRVIRDLGAMGIFGTIRFYDPALSRVVRKPAALMDYFIPAPVPGSAGAQRLAKLKFESGATVSESLWVFSRSIGAGWWASTSSSARKLVERIARSEFMRTQKAEHATLWYVALGRHSTIAALFKAQQDMRMATFFKRNFALPENKTAASKNAYVLVAKHRLLLATAFFILAGDVKGALNLVKSRIRDEQLYILLARILKNGEYLNECLENVIKSSENRHTRAMAMWLNGNHEQAVSVASETERVTKNDSVTSFPLGAGLPPAVFTLGHVLAMSDRPPVKGMEFTIEHVQACRWAAVRALQAHESPSATLKATYDLIRLLQPDNVQRSRTSSLGYLRSAQSISAAVGAVKSRAVSFAGAIRSGVTRRKLLVSVQSDLATLLGSFLDLDSLVEVAVLASTDLSRADEVDAAVATALAGNMVANERQSKILNQRMTVALESCLRVLVSRALSHVHCAVSLLHQPLTTKSFLDEVLGKTTSAIHMLDESSTILNSSFDELIREFKGTELALRFGVGFLGGDWLDVLSSLRNCETLWPESVSGLHPNSAERVRDGETCSSVSAETVSVEALRHMASNPAVLGMSPGLGHRRRKRRAPSMTLIAHHSASAATVPDETGGIPTLSVVGNDPLALIRIHPALSSTLCASALAYLSTHLASRASRFEKYCSSSRFRESMNSSYSDVRSLMGFRLIDSTEALEHLANDAMAGWVPLPPFGAEANEGCLRHPDVSAGAFVDLWTVLGCLPEYAPVLSEAATVAAAELAGAASRAAVEAAEVRDGGRRMRRRRKRKGERVLNIEKEGLQHLDTTADLALYGAYPVRFSSTARGPWSGRGRNASLYQESSALFRKLCVSSTDPPSVVVATPKGIQEIVPSSYTTMPAGFRSHYLTQKQKRKKRAQERKLEALEQQKARDERAAVNAADDEIIRSFDAGFGEGAYIPLSLSNANTHRSTVMRNKKAIWRHQVEATALCSHPLRRRFATGGTDGCVRLWDFTDPVCIASFRETRYGRVTDLSFSAYGSRLLAVHSSGHVAIWNDPDNYRSLDENTPANRRRKAQLITAFDNRAANGGIFVDEQHTIAVVGDPMAPPVVGDSLRVFDTRDANSAFRASWSARVHDHGESRCIALLEDRVRIVSGGVNGSLSVVDLRTRGCIAELPAHEDEVTCLGVEWPRERAIASGCRNGDIKVWDSRTLLQLDVLHGAHTPTRHYWSGSGIGGLVGSYGTTSLALTNRSLISCGGDGVVKVWGPGFANYDLHVL